MIVKWRRVNPGHYEGTIDGQKIELIREPYHRAIWSLMGDGISTTTHDTRQAANGYIDRQTRAGLPL